MASQTTQSTDNILTKEEQEMINEALLKEYLESQGESLEEYISTANFTVPQITDDIDNADDTFNDYDKVAYPVQKKYVKPPKDIDISVLLDFIENLDKQEIEFSMSIIKNDFKTIIFDKENKKTIFNKLDGLNEVQKDIIETRLKEKMKKYD
jgi:hypothetical protein